MRTLLAVVAVLSTTLAACGASVSAEPIDDSGTDAAPDSADPDTSPDSGPTGCGVGSCSVDTTCFDGCNTCYCTPPGNWSCTGAYCEDSGLWETSPPPPPPDSAPWPDTAPPPVCPKSLPTPGSICPASLKCAYMNSCGSSDYAYCEYPGARWNVSIGPCTAPCPAYLPKEGTTCSGPAKCDYVKPCGAYDHAYCESSTSKWKIYYNPCPEPPPPPPPCPTTVPKEGSFCSSPYSSCAWNNGCGALIHGFCEGGRWWLSDSGCVPGCPATKPTSGVACKPPSSEACTYVVSSSGSSYCESTCFCAEDSRWACIPGGCSSSGGGGGGFADAGTPIPPG